MARTNNNANIDTSTEEKIKEAARVVFTRNGYAATKVRDIAAEAGINVALVNYYFRSKEKLFQLIMEETIKKLFDKIQKIINDESSTIIEKIENVVDHYISLLIENPDLPMFFISEVMSGSNKIPIMTDNGKLFLNIGWNHPNHERLLVGRGSRRAISRGKAPLERRPTSLTFSVNESAIR